MFNRQNTELKEKLSTLQLWQQQMIALQQSSREFEDKVDIVNEMDSLKRMQHIQNVISQSQTPLAA